MASPTTGVTTILAAEVVVDPEETVRLDVERPRSSTTPARHDDLGDDVYDVYWADHYHRPEPRPWPRPAAASTWLARRLLDV